MCNRWFRWWPVLVLGLLCCGACGPQNRPTYPVSGKVVFGDQTPLSTGGVVIMESIPDAGLPVGARGVINEDGTFEMGTFGERDGAVPGKHQVLIRAQRDTTGYPADYLERGMIPRPVIDPRFEAYETSDLEATVTEGENTFTFVVERPK